jgi:hypothetical protein
VARGGRTGEPRAVRQTRREAWGRVGRILLRESSAGVVVEPPSVAPRRRVRCRHPSAGGTRLLRIRGARGWQPQPGSAVRSWGRRRLGVPPERVAAQRWPEGFLLQKGAHASLRIAVGWVGLEAKRGLPCRGEEAEVLRTAVRGAGCVRSWRAGSSSVRSWRRLGLGRTLSNERLHLTARSFCHASHRGRRLAASVRSSALRFGPPVGVPWHAAGGQVSRKPLSAQQRLDWGEESGLLARLHCRRWSTLRCLRATDARRQTRSSVHERGIALRSPVQARVARARAVRAGRITMQWSRPAAVGGTPSLVAAGRRRSWLTRRRPSGEAWLVHGRPAAHRRAVRQPGR